MGITEALDCGISLNEASIPIEETTRMVTQFFQINPLALISSGSMLIAIPANQGPTLLEALHENDITAGIIGATRQDKKKLLFTSDKQEHTLVAPERDAIHDIIIS